MKQIKIVKTMKYHILKINILLFGLVFKLQAQDVYIGGQEFLEPMGGVAVYWKNCQPHYVKIRGGAYANSFINSIYIVGKDVYAVGAEAHSGWGQGAVYWKNDNEVNDLSTKREQLSDAKSIFISNNDLRIACSKVGSSLSKAYYWVNGIVTELPSPPIGQGYANSIYYSENKTYTAGYSRTVAGNRVAKYWTNKKETKLTDGKRNAEASSIFIYDNHIYISGWEQSKEPTMFNVFPNRTAKYWINSKDRVVNLTDGRYDACVNSIFVYDGVVYVAGWEENDKGKKVAKYWKNNGESATTLSNGESNAEATSIFVYNGNVYISGTDGFIAKYWVNDIHGEVVLSDKTSSANSIFVVEGDNKKQEIEDSKQPEENNKNRDDLVAARGDEFLAGYENKNGKTVAKYWKNGVETVLTNGQRNAKALSVFATETNDVYACGWEENGSGVKVAKYWKNKDGATELSTGLYDAEAVAIFVVNQKVYTAGYTTTAQSVRKATYWENNILNRLSDVSEDASATSIFVSDGIVYVAGFEVNSAKIAVAKYWENNVVIPLSDGTKNAIASSIFKKGNDVFVTGAIKKGEGWEPVNWRNQKASTEGSRQFVFANAVPVNRHRSDGYVTSMYYANGINNSYSKDIANIVTPVEIESSIMPRYIEPKIDLDEVRFKRAQEIMHTHITRKGFGPDYDKYHLIGVLEDFFDERPIFILRYRKFDGSIETLEINWNGWGECWLDEVTDECHMTRSFVDADDFKKSTCRKGRIVDIRRVKGVEIKIKFIQHIGY